MFNVNHIDENLPSSTPCSPLQYTWASAACPDEAAITSSTFIEKLEFDKQAGSTTRQTVVRDSTPEPPSRHAPTPCPPLTPWQRFQAHVIFFLSLILYLLIWCKLSHSPTTLALHSSAWLRFLDTLPWNAVTSVLIAFYFLLVRHCWGNKGPLDFYWRGAPGQHISILLTQVGFQWYVGLIVYSVLKAWVA